MLKGSGVKRMTEHVLLALYTSISTIIPDQGGGLVEEHPVFDLFLQ